eukprot:12448437-Alexandrium_andersonii.AAC.1
MRITRGLVACFHWSTLALKRSHHDLMSSREHAGETQGAWATTTMKRASGALTSTASVRGSARIV